MVQPQQSQQGRKSSKAIIDSSDSLPGICNYYANATKNVDHTKSDKYHKALLHGRHPRSFNRAGEVWEYLDTSQSRVSDVKTGHCLSSLVEKHKNSSRLKPSASTYSIHKIRKKAQKNAMKLSRSLSTLDRTVTKTVVVKDSPRSAIKLLGKQPQPRVRESVAPQPLPAFEAEIPAEIAIRSEFTSKDDRTILHYGCTISMEIFTGDFLMIGSSDGTARAQTLDQLDHQPKGRRDRVQFKLIDLTDLQNAGQIRYGDIVYLQVTAGTGGSWEQGGIVGVQVREAPHLQVMSRSSKTMSTIGKQQAETASVGYPVPISANIPKHRDDKQESSGDFQQESYKNKIAARLGRWIIRSATYVSKDMPNSEFVHNNDEVVFEQDWFYLGSDSVTKRAVLRQLPTVPQRLKAGEYKVDRRGTWRLHLIDTDDNGVGSSFTQMKMEKLLYKAKVQLKSSSKMRIGESKTYNKELHCGADFPVQIRKQIQNLSLLCDDVYFSEEERKLQNLDSYFENRFKAVMPKGNGNITSNSTAPSSPVHRRRSSSVIFLKKERASNFRREVDLANLPCSLCGSSSMHYDLCSENFEVNKTFKKEGNASYSYAEPVKEVVPNSESVSNIMKLLCKEDSKMTGIISSKKANVSMMYAKLQDDDSEESHVLSEDELKLIRSGSVMIEELPTTTAEDNTTTDLPAIESDSDEEDSNEENVELTVSEICSLPLVDIENTLGAYVGSKNTLIEMLQGFVEICADTLLPQLKAAFESQHKTALLENADCLARSAEFVSARRIQLAVHDVIKAIARSEAKSFTGISEPYEKLIEVLDETLSYAKDLTATAEAEEGSEEGDS